MSEFDHNEVEGYQGLLEINNSVAEATASQSRLEMFANILAEAKNVTVLSSRMMESIIKDIDDIPNKYYDKCHSKSGAHVKSGIGGGSFSRSYERNCR